MFLLVFPLAALVLLCGGIVMFMRREWQRGWLMIIGAVVFQGIAVALSSQRVDVVVGTLGM